MGGAGIILGAAPIGSQIVRFKGKYSVLASDVVGVLLSNVQPFSGMLAKSSIGSGKVSVGLTRLLLQQQ